MALVANGKAELAVNQLHSLASVPGLEIVGPLPGDLQHSIVFSAAIVSGTRDTAAAKALIAFLRAPDSAAVIKAKGMQPG